MMISRIIYLIVITLPIMVLVDISEGVKINFALADIFVAILAFIILMNYRKLSIKNNFPYWWYFVGLFLLMLVSNLAAYFSENIVSGSLLMQINEGIKFIVIGLYFYVGFNCINDKNDLLKISFIWTCTAAIVCILGIIATVAAYNGVVFDSFLLEANGRRLSSTLTDPNLAAAYLSVSFFVGLLFVHFSNNKWQSRVGYFTLLFIVISILLTQSRSGMIAFIIALIFYFVLIFKKTSKSKIIPIFFLLALVSFFTFLSIDARIFDKELTKNLENRFGQVIELSGEAEVRTNLAKAAFEMGKDHPLLGVGRGNFRLNSQPYYEQIGIDTESKSFERQYGIKIPHNTYATFFAELGIVGLLLFLVVFYFGIRNNLKYRKVNIIFLALLLSYLVQAFAINLENFRGIWFILGFIFATIKMGFDQELLETEKQVEFSYKKYSVIFAVLLISCLLFYIDAGGKYTRPIYIEKNNIVEYVDGVTINENYVFEYHIDVDNPEINQYSSKISIYSVKDDEELLLNEVLYKAPEGVGSLTFVPQSERLKIEIVPISEDVRIQLKDAKVVNPTTGLGKNIFADYTFLPLSGEKVLQNMGLINMWGKTSVSYFFGIPESVNLSDKVLVKDVKKQELPDGNIKLTFQFECIGKMEVDYRIWFHANVIDKYILPENRLEHGFHNWDHSLDTKTSQWEVGETYIHEYTVKANPGQYHDLRFGFWNSKGIDGETHRLQPSVNIGHIQIRGERVN